MFKLIPDARLAWRFASVQAALVLTILTAVQADLVPMLQPLMDQTTYLKVSALLSFLVIVLRVIAQPALEPERQQLELDQAEAQHMPGLSAEDEEVDGMAMALYEAGGLSKAWANVSAESKAKWRTVARAALQRTAPVDAGGEHF